ncbi:ankyrin repeat domain-containing protein [Shewanella sp. JL219SE-S6]
MSTEILIIITQKIHLLIEVESMIRLIGFASKRLVNTMDIFSVIKSRDVDLFNKNVGALCVNDKDEHGLSALHVAIVESMDEMATYIVENGADLNAKDPFGNSPLHYCADFHNFRVAELLILSGADLNIRNDIGDIPLMNVVFETTPDNLSMLELFLNHTKSVDIKNKFGSSPMDLAVNIGMESVVSLFDEHVRKNNSHIKYIADVDIKIIDVSGSDDDVAQWVWDNLVPAEGQSNTIQGELLRAVEKLRWEAMENGNVNWDEGFLKLIGFIEKVFVEQPGLNEIDKARILRDLAVLSEFNPGSVHDKRTSLLVFNDDTYDRLAYFVVQFCRLNRRLISRNKDPEQYR